MHDVLFVIVSRIVNSDYSRHQQTTVARERRDRFVRGNIVVTTIEVGNGRRPVHHLHTNSRGGGQNAEQFHGIHAGQLQGQ